ncbi:MAG TPA: DDE-type integrase/transposase/recombinase [Anaerolineaceae bacterium]|nr:DDE-type integrase/transposase/recombinase [Anaerolineaceae bacterium]
MSQRSKKEVLERIRARYLKASKAEKQIILDELTATTGYNRKYAIRVLRHPRRSKGLKKAGRKRRYTGETIQILEQLWEMGGRLCSKRLHPFLPEWIRKLEECGEISLTHEVKAQLLSMSRSTIDRRLQPARIKEKRRGLSTTKPGTLLKRQIPVRIYTPWDEQQPGFLEIDLVAHCGETTAGNYLNTLTATDLATGWTECLALPNKTQTATFLAIKKLQERLPFPLLGLDSDNGSEFINDMLYRFCLDQQITFTRCRPYRKNDQAHVEQKNWSVVRHTVGYDRFETQAELDLLSSIYADLRLFVNFFQPVEKLISSTTINGVKHKQYDQAKTPYQRVLEDPRVDEKYKTQLRILYNSLNPVTIREALIEKTARMLKIA